MFVMIVRIVGIGGVVFAGGYLVSIIIMVMVMIGIGLLLIG